MWGAFELISKRGTLFRDHPHVCGEHTISTGDLRWLLGSSPRVWGALRVLFSQTARERIIPTCVGSIMAQTHLREIPRDHPHVCGEHANTREITAHDRGSSPRVWGALMGAPCIRIPSRIIPTCVGSIQWRAWSRQIRWDHPHVCGEHPSPALSSVPSKGSSPRVWGASTGNVSSSSATGIIPTCVGSMGS